MLGRLHRRAQSPPLSLQGRWTKTKILSSHQRPWYSPGQEIWHLCWIGNKNRQTYNRYHWHKNSLPVKDPWTQTSIAETETWSPRAASHLFSKSGEGLGRPKNSMIITMKWWEEAQGSNTKKLNKLLKRMLGGGGMRVTGLRSSPPVRKLYWRVW